MDNGAIENRVTTVEAELKEDREQRTERTLYWKQPLISGRIPGSL